MHHMLWPQLLLLITAAFRAQCERRACHYDQYVIATTKQLSSILTKSVAGHLPREISRLMYFIILHGVRVSVKALDVHHWKLPLIQGGLEFPVEVTVEMADTAENRLTMAKYETITAER